MDPVLVVGNIALLCTIASNFSGLPICVGFFRKGSTSNVPVLPFIAGATCTSLWLLYSIIREDRMLQTVNVIASFLQTSYVVCYYINTADKSKTKQLSSIVIVFFVTISVYVFQVADKMTGTTMLGYLAAAGSVTACAAPLATVAEVIKTKSSESLLAPVIFSTFIVTSLWYFYGVLVNDAFIQVPNLIGAILTGTQLCLIAIYPAKDRLTTSKED